MRLLRRVKLLVSGIALFSANAVLSNVAACADASATKLPAGKMLAFTLDHHSIAFFEDANSAEGTASVGIQGAQPALSPNGKYIAYDDHGLCVADVSGQNVRRLTSDECGTFPSWSPSSGRLVYSAQGGSIRIINLDGSGDHAITKADGCNQASWSRDGRWIAFVKSGKVAMMNAQGMERRTIFENSDSRRPSLNADNSLIVFAAGGYERDETRDGGPDGERQRHYSEVFTVRTDTPRKQRVFIKKVSPEKTDCDFPCWSKDGKWIAFDGSEGGEGYDIYNIFVVRADGSDLKQLTHSVFDSRFPTWQ